MMMYRRADIYTRVCLLLKVGSVSKTNMTILLGLLLLFAFMIAEGVSRNRKDIAFEFKHGIAQGVGPFLVGAFYALSFVLFIVASIVIIVHFI